MTLAELRALCDAHGISITISGYIRETDAARIFGISLLTMQRWRADRTGPQAQRVGGTWRWPTGDDDDGHDGVPAWPMGRGLRISIREG